MSVPRVILKLPQKGIYGSPGRSPTNRSFAFGGPLGRAAWEATWTQEERKEYAMTSPKDAALEPKPQKRVYYGMRAHIRSYMPEQWDEFLTKLAERMIKDLKNAGAWPDSEDPIPVEPKTEELI